MTTVSASASVERRRSQLRQARHRRRAEDDLGARRSRLGHVGGAASIAPSSSARSRFAGSGSKPDHLGAEPLPRGEPDRAADQPDAEDGDPHPPRRALAAEASWLRAPRRLRSQSMQASVIDWP